MSGAARARARARARIGIGSLLLLLLAHAATTAHAHELRPALLSVTEVGQDEYDVELRVPAEVSMSEGPVPVLPPGSAAFGPTTRARAGDTVLERFRARVPGGLPGRRLGVRFAGGGGSEILVRVATRDGATRTGRLLARPGSPSADWLVPARPGTLAVARTYLGLGVEHILTGADHLAFVLGLVLLARSWRKLWKTVTAFTVAHSLTLALAALGIARVPPPPVEAVIAVSILFVAREVWLAQRGLPGLIARHPWPVAFAFGLLHGLGFASALLQVGLPDSDIPLALVSFNVGVEIGQLCFVAAALLAGRLLARRPWAQRAGVRLVPAYAIGTLAACWWFDRVAQFWR